MITGGEIDKLSVAQMLRDYQISRGQDDYDRTAVVSCTAGDGVSNKRLPLFFNGAVDFFKELPKSDDMDGMRRVS